MYNELVECGEKMLCNVLFEFFLEFEEFLKSWIRGEVCEYLVWWLLLVFFLFFGVILVGKVDLSKKVFDLF